MSRPDQNRLTEALQRGRFTAQEEAQLEALLAEQPGSRAAWEAELQLNRLLDQIPNAPLSSNFTARVMRGIHQQDQPLSRDSLPRWRRLIFKGWFPKAATAAALLCLGLFSYQQHRAQERTEMARNLAEASDLASATPLEWLENFEVIERLNQVPRDVDRDLIAALQ